MCASHSYLKLARLTSIVPVCAHMCVRVCLTCTQMARLQGQVFTGIVCACVCLTCTQMARLQGQVFILKSEVNLLSSVMDIPDFFWTTPDALRSVYDKVGCYAHSVCVCVFVCVFCHYMLACRCACARVACEGLRLLS